MYIYCARPVEIEGEFLKYFFFLTFKSLKYMSYEFSFTDTWNQIQRGENNYKQICHLVQQY
jgi:hypothetical protein